MAGACRRGPRPSKTGVGSGVTPPPPQAVLEQLRMMRLELTVREGLWAMGSSDSESGLPRPGLGDSGHQASLPNQEPILSWKRGL